MANPWTLSGPRVLLSTPEYNWEKHGWWVNEGPTILSHNKRHWLVYSASGGSTPFYASACSSFKGRTLTPRCWESRASRSSR
jgi:GH43 family beta-xylosidase